MNVSSLSKSNYSQQVLIDKIHEFVLTVHASLPAPLLLNDELNQMNQ